MRESEREGIKLRAAFFNSLATVIFAVLAIPVAYRIAQTASGHEFEIIDYLRALSVAIIGSFTGFFLHRVAQASLRRLDDDYIAPKQSAVSSFLDLSILMAAVAIPLVTLALLYLV